MNYTTLHALLVTYITDEHELNKDPGVADYYAGKIVNLVREWEKKEKTRIQSEVEEMNQKYREGDSTW